MINYRMQNFSYLDRIRLNDGIYRCKAVFHETYQKNRLKAMAMVNDRRLTFPSLFILIPQIESLHLGLFLNPRNAAAFKIIQEILKKRNQNNKNDILSIKANATYSVLKWILQTGHTDDGLSDDYEQIMDVTISVLICLYKDKTILPLVTDMIFHRYKNGHNLHDLVWALFQIRDPDVLKLVAEHMRSTDPDEIEFARVLLNVESSNENGIPNDNQEQYQSYMQWLNENDPFLYFTEESFQYSSKPAFCNVDMDRKYLSKGIPSYNKQPITPLDENEKQSLQAFKPLSNEEKKILSGYSYKMHNNNTAEWKKWLMYPIHEQLRIAKAEQEDTRWL